MFVLKGQLLNVFETPKGTSKDGEKYGGDDKIQVLHEVHLKNGEKRMDLETLSVPDASVYKDKIGQQIAINVLLSVWQGKLMVKAA